MPASLKFESVQGTTTADLSQAKIITLTDQNNNTYILDVTGSDLKLEYTPHGGAKVSHTVNDLATALGSLLSTKDNNKSVLVDTLGEFLGSPDTAKYDGKSNQTAKAFLGGKGLKGADGALGPKGDKGPQGDNGADGALGPKGADGALGPKGDKGDTGPEGANGKNGTSPSAAQIAAEPALQAHVAKINIKSPEFKEAVQEEMSQPHFDIPASDDAALNWTW